MKNLKFSKLDWIPRYAILGHIYTLDFSEGRLLCNVFEVLCTSPEALARKSVWHFNKAFVTEAFQSGCHGNGD
jgi:hypothetical protein